MPTIVHRLNIGLLFDGTLGQGGWIAMEVLLMIPPHGHQLGQTAWPNANNKQELHY